MDVDVLQSALWRDVVEDKLLRVYSIQDCAASPRIFPNFVIAMTDNVCLYEGKLPKVLLEAAPHLVRLAAVAAYTRWYLQESWRNNWGVFFQSKANLTSLRQHFQRLLLVKRESGRILSFRFYDPRVLRVYLPTCTPEELSAVFGPVERFFVESEDGKELLRFSFEENKLGIKRVPVAPLKSGASTVSAALVSPKSGK